MHSRIHLTTQDSFQLEYDTFGKFVLVEADGTRHVGVTAVRAFPISDPPHGLSLLSAEGHELAWIDDISELPQATRSTVESELAQREFLPQIRRIVGVSLQIDPCEWQVETDRGPTKFVLKSEDDVRRLDDLRATVTDAHGVRYLIPDTGSLDRRSRRILERYL
jgi:hypothetical protein